MLQTKDTDWLNGYKYKIHIYAIYKKPLSDLKTYRLKVRECKKYIPCKWEPEESWNINPHIRQSRP